MDLFKDDLFKNKYFVSLIVIMVIVLGIFWFIDYNSVSAKCRRYAEGLGSMLGTGSNKLGNMQLQRGMESIIQDCIDRGGP